LSDILEILEKTYNPACESWVI